MRWRLLAVPVTLFAALAFAPPSRASGTNGAHGANGANGANGAPTPDDFASWAALPMDVDGIQLRFTFLFPKVERPTRMPLLITARNGNADVDGTAPAVVTVSICSDWQCEMREQVSVPVDGAPVIVEATNWPGAFLRVDGRWGEVACCTTEVLAHVIVSTRKPTRTQRLGSENTSTNAIAWRSDVGEVLTRFPEYVSGVSAVIVADGDALDVDVMATFVEQGGVLSIPEHQAQRFGLDGTGRPVVRNTPLDGSPEYDLTLDERGTDLPIPAGTRAVDRGAGTFILRPAGASPNEELAGVVNARPRLLEAPLPNDVESLTEVAGVALGKRPSRAASFALVLAAIVGVVVVVKRARKLGWQRAVVASFGLGVGAAAALWLLELATVPSETRARVLMWTGPNAAQEIGVDAVRPRGVSTVEVRGPVALLGATSVGHAASFRQVVTRSEDGRVAEARIDSSMGLLGLWTRPAPRPRAVELVGTDIVNHLDVPLLAVLTANGTRFHGVVGAGARVHEAALSDVRTGLYDEELLAHLVPEERRLLQEMLTRCQMGTRGGLPSCASAIARLADGTLVGLEVAQ